MKTKLTIVAENTVAMPFIPGVTAGLLGEHGLAVLIETETERWLYDTGRGKALIPNLTTLNVSADSLNGVILSHGHLDHVSGLAELLKIRLKPLTVYAHPGIFINRFHKPGDKLKPVGMTPNRTQLERMGAVFQFNEDPSMLAPGLWLTGRIPRENAFETIQEPFFVEESQGLAPDLIWDEQALAIEGEHGVFILSGCSHAGIVNIMSRVKEILPEQKIWGIMGGLHLLNAGQRRLDLTIEALKAEQLEFVSVGHCTGFCETAAIAAALPEVFHCMNTGISFTV
jgi:7,8-dihydropterin-6-yl-methyl-4-(beta-D-ribofuranosyl)aminobenzene 5'-phosphate synthase